MFDFKSLLNEMEQGRRRSFLSVGVVCFFALVLIIGLGVFSSTSQLSQQPSSSPTMTGRELFNKVVEQKKAALEKQAALEAQQAAKEAQQTPSNLAASQPSPKSIAPTSQQPLKPTNAPNISAPSNLSKSQVSDVKQSNAKDVSQPDTTAKSRQVAEKENPYFSILHEPWPPSSAKGATKVESTFVPRLGSMFLMLCITCTIIWVSLKIFAPLFNKFTGTSAAPQNHLNIVERKALAPNKSLVLIETHGQHVLLGVTDQSISTLASFDIPQSEPLEPKELTDLSNQSTPSSEDSNNQSAEQKSSQESASSETESQGKKKNLVKEVICQHFSSLPLPKINK